MQTDKPNISEKDRNSILIQIINCANCALQDEDAFQKAMQKLATEFRLIFESEYCSIGIVGDGFAEDCMTSYAKFEDEQLSKKQIKAFESVKRVDINNYKYAVCQAVNSDKDIYFYQEQIERFGNYKDYQTILPSGDVKNSCVIPIRDHEKKAYGFIQFINTKKSIDFERDIMPYRDALLGLVQIIINNQKNQQELVKKENRLKDADFYNIMQDKKDNVNELLDSIMEYFSKEFNAAVITFRIPVLNGYKKDPIFYLRRVFVHPSVRNQEEVVNQYYEERLVKNKDGMHVADDLRCDDQGKILKSKSSTDFSQYGLDLYENTLIMPIIRDIDKKCIHPDKEDQVFCNPKEHHDCLYRFRRFYGFFRLRISKISLSESYCNNSNPINSEETINRLTYLSKQISLLLNSIVEKYENESLRTFQNELKNSSFIKIKEFDERCVEIIRKSVDAKECSIYRYNELTKFLALSATTAKKIRFNGINVIKDAVINNCFTRIDASNNVLARVFKAKLPKNIFDISDSTIHHSSFIETVENTTNDRFKSSSSAVVVPMLKKDGTCAGIVLLLGKKNHRHSVSTTFWEHDIEHIEFIVNILTRISESNTERLTFLSQLSHELLSPVTELVYDNDLTVNVAGRNPESFSRDKLISKICENINRNMLFKYIISDTEFIYSSGNRSIDYNVVKQEEPQRILLDAVRLLEKDANYKGLTIQTNISDMPSLYFDKERMTQVFINLLKNAIRYSIPSTTHHTIGIYYKFDSNVHEIRFVNYGIGVKKEEKDTIFGLFYRGESAKKKFTRGTGMGLYIVRDIMRAHGGDCYVRRLNNPTEFVITLPNRE